MRHHPVQEIRRYDNRKLYCCTESRYITLPEIGTRFIDGQGFCIRDNKTREDVTVLYLVKALVSINHFNRVIEVMNNERCHDNLKEHLPKEFDDVQ